MNRRCAIYARVSTDRQEREGTSLESQVERCLAHAAERGWTIERVVQEQGSGGDIDGRPKLEALMGMARSGLIDVLVCYHIDRLSRDVDDQGWIKRELKKAGCQLVLITGQQDRMYQAVEGAMAMQERKQIRERIKRGKEQIARRGRYIPGGGPPYGYRFRYAMIDRAEKVVDLDPDPVTASIVRQIFEFVASGRTATACVRWLQEQGIPTPRGRQWWHSTITGIVENTTYRGECVALRSETVEDEVTGAIEVAWRAPEGRVVLPADTAPALVSADLWRRANEQIHQGKRGSRRNNRDPETYLLRAGFIRCGYCGGAVSASMHGGRPVYYCTQRVQRGCPKRSSIAAERLDQEIWSVALEVLKHPDWIREQLRAQADDGTLGKRIEEAQAALARHRQEEATLAERVGLLDDPTPVVMRLNTVSLARRQAEQELDQLRFQQTAADRISQQISLVDERFVAAQARVDEMAYEEKRAMLREFGVAITLFAADHEPRYEVDWCFDLGGLDPWQTGEEGDDDGVDVIYTRDSLCLTDSRHDSPLSAMSHWTSISYVVIQRSSWNGSILTWLCPFLAIDQPFPAS